jgi:hypothetical protein
LPVTALSPGISHVLVALISAATASALTALAFRWDIFHWLKGPQRSWSAYKSGGGSNIREFQPEVRILPRIASATEDCRKQDPFDRRPRSE